MKRQEKRKVTSKVCHLATLVATKLSVWADNQCFAFALLCFLLVIVLYYQLTVIVLSTLLILGFDSYILYGMMCGLLIPLAFLALGPSIHSNSC